MNDVPAGSRTLLLFRHAKSSWEDDSLADIERPLKGSGRRDADAMGRLLSQRGLWPPLVLCSASQRTRETLAHMLPHLDVPARIEVEEGLYEAGERVLLERVRRVDDVVPAIMLIAHNPGLEDLALRLTAEAAGDALERMRTKFPTAALAVLRLRVGGWAKLAPGAAALTEFVTPRDL